MRLLSCLSAANGLVSMLFLILLRNTSADPDLVDSLGSVHLERGIEHQIAVVAPEDQRLRRGLQAPQFSFYNLFLDSYFAFFDYLKSLFSNDTSRNPRTCDLPNSQPPLPGKKGIGYTMRADEQEGSATENMPKVKALSVSWNYSWGRERPEEQPEGVEFVPMIWGFWGDEESLAQQIAEVRAEYDAGRVRRLLGFNEPDHVKQSNMAVGRAVSVWKHFEDSGMPIVSPSPAHGEREWMTTFMKSVNNDPCLRMEWIGTHWYGGPNAESFKNHMTDLYSLYGSKRPLLITEFAPADWTTGGDPTRNRWTKEEVLKFAKEVIPWLEQQDFIAGYAWFPFGQDSPQGHPSALFDLSNELTTLGRYYASVTPDNIYGEQSIS